MMQQAGLKLVAHQHTNDNVHFTIVISGSISVTRGDAEPEIYEAGSVLDFESHVLHTITAVEPMTSIINVIKANLVAPTETELNPVGY